MLSDREKREAEKRRERGDKEGKQYVENTLEAKVACKKAQGGKGEKGKTKAELLGEARKQGVKGRSTMSKGELERAFSKG